MDNTTNYTPTLHVFPDGPAVARAFADHIVDKLAQTEEGPLFWALSGGSTPKLLFKLLASAPHSHFTTPALTERPNRLYAS